MSHPRQVAVMALNEIERKDTYADVALQRQLAKSRLTGGDSRLGDGVGVWSGGDDGDRSML